MNAAAESGWLLRWFLVALTVGSVLLAPSPAAGDVGVVRVHPAVAAPGQSVTVEVGCGGPCGPRMPISLVPLAQAPVPRPCTFRGEKAVCSPHAAEPPRRPPYVLLGTATQDSPPSAVLTDYRLRFRVPTVTPGAYAFVICSGCASGRRGTLVVNGTQPGQLLRVSSAQNVVSSQGSGTDAPWFIAGAVALAAVTGAAVLLRRRRAQ
jgi:hypothetical protein